MIRNFFLISLILIAACGYQPVYNKNLSDYKFYEINLQGDQSINNKIINTLKITQSNEVEFFDKLSIKSSKNIQETSKNSKGQVDTYRSIFNVEVSVIRDNEIIKKQNFDESFSYDNKTSKFELTQYQVEVDNIIINKIIKDLAFFLN